MIENGPVPHADRRPASLVFCVGYLEIASCCIQSGVDLSFLVVVGVAAIGTVLESMTSFCAVEAETSLHASLTFFIGQRKEFLVSRGVQVHGSTARGCGRGFGGVPNETSSIRGVSSVFGGAPMAIGGSPMTVVFLVKGTRVSS